jgi:oligopeptide transport system substrate-binding protein
MKKTLMLSIAFMFTLFVVACTTPTFKVTVQLNDGSTPQVVEVEEGAFLPAQATPTRPDVNGKAYSFTGWFTDSALTEVYDFSTPVNADLTLYAGWSLDVVLSLDTKLQANVQRVLLGEDGGVAQAPAAPTRDGYRFGGWFRGRAGLTWLEPSPVEFPLNVEESTTLFAYWEPLDSKAINYSVGETYTSTFLATNPLILNPLVYQYSSEDAYIGLMTTSMYPTEVDWDKAVDDGVADYPGDFSKFEAREFSIEALDFKYILGGATRYPIDSKGNEFLNSEGQFDRDQSTKVTDTVWTINIREDLKFENGTPITADTFEFALQQYLSKDQNNRRATIFYRDDVNTNGSPVLNSAAYFKQNAVDEDDNAVATTWDEVGFEVLSDYSFRVTFSIPQTQADAVGFANSLRLIEPDVYLASLNAQFESSYGTPANPFISYGPYLIKSWDANQKLVLNKNFDYVLRELITYKSLAVEYIPDLATGYNLYKAGSTSVLGLTNAYYSEFAENPNVYKAWDGFPQYIILNLAGSLLEEGGHVQPEIMFDKRFRQALFFGFDRKFFADNVYAPNTASILTVPLDTKVYVQDPLYYSESPNHLQVLEDFNIDPETVGYIPERAKELFDLAYADYIADGNTGPVTLRMIADDSDPLLVSMANFVKSSYENLFGSDKLIVNIIFGNTDATDLLAETWEFDLNLSAIGYGRSYGITDQYPAITFRGALIGGGSFGLSQPYDLSGTEEDAKGNKLGDYLFEELRVDLTPTYEYLLTLEDDETTPVKWLELLDWLKEDGDKPAGIYLGTIAQLGGYVSPLLSTPFGKVASAPFPGATQEVWKIIAAMEAIFLDYVTLVPTVTRSSATVYADNVEITWPLYHSSFGWGAARYRYLSSDPDFADGLYNSFAN